MFFTVGCLAQADPVDYEGFGGATAQPDSGSATGGSVASGTGATSAATGGTGGTGDTEPPPYVEPVEPIDLYELPSGVPTVRLDVDSASLALLEKDPFTAEDVIGSFTDGSGTTYQNIDVNYRGAYALKGLIDSGRVQRNWKVKFSKQQMYRSRREWNYNFEPHLRQKLAYDLMKFSGVRVPSARHVLLVVNGQSHGLYLEYEDPDSKDWLSDKFGDSSGDLFKAATDLPGMTPYFATTEHLGDADSSYFQHYQKKTNEDLYPEDYSTLRAFLYGLNHTPSSELAAWYEANLDVGKFIRYLVVGNFISHWDGPPQRPKNYWLYNIPWAKRWVFIPWDIDSTFQPYTFSLNPMGTDASVFYQLDHYQTYKLSQNEGTERPLVRKLMAIPEYRSAYVAAYKQALNTYLAKSYLLDRVQKLQNLVSAVASSSDRANLDETCEEIRIFIHARHDAVSYELSRL